LLHRGACLAQKLLYLPPSAATGLQTRQMLHNAAPARPDQQNWEGGNVRRNR